MLQASRCRSYAEKHSTEQYAVCTVVLKLQGRGTDQAWLAIMTQCSHQNLHVEAVRGEEDQPQRLKDKMLARLQKDIMASSVVNSAR